jgi:hypothetical protein
LGWYPLKRPSENNFECSGFRLGPRSTRPADIGIRWLERTRLKLPTGRKRREAIPFHTIIRVHILLDSRDLINVGEHDRPLPAAEFDGYLRAGNHQIVLCFSNVRELAGPLAQGADFFPIRELLQTLEAMPHTYLKEATIVAIEIQAAVAAFEAGTEYVQPTPYVRRWDYTLGLAPEDRGPVAADLLNLRLDEIVYHIHRHRPDVFAPPNHHLGALRDLLQNERALVRARRNPPRRHFAVSLRNHAASHHVRLPTGREDEFGAWVYANPNRCPGLRLNHEIFRALTANYDDVPEASDFADLALTCVVPYVDAVTLDRRMRNYCGIASRRMIEFGAASNFRDRVYDDVADLLQRQ